MIKNYGFIEPVIEDKHYILGGAVSLPEVVLQENRQWDEFLPKYEPQFGDGWDTSGCTIWGTENAIEIIFKRLFGVEKNYSERSVYIGTRTRPPGNDPHVIADWIYDNGLIDDAQLPMTFSFEEFITPDPLPKNLIAQGKLWCERYRFGHEWVFMGDHSKEERITRIMKGLTMSPLGVSVTAWHQGEDGIYQDDGKRNTHWCVCYGHTDKGWKIFDSYDQSTKIYSYDSEISYCKRYYINETIPEKKIGGFFATILEIIKRFFRFKQ